MDWLHIVFSAAVSEGDVENFTGAYGVRVSDEPGIIVEPLVLDIARLERTRETGFEQGFHLSIVFAEIDLIRGLEALQPGH